MKNNTAQRLKRIAFHCVLLLSLLSVVAAPAGPPARAVAPADAAETTASTWYDGPIQFSSIINCFSIIQGSPYMENGVGTYVGFLADPTSQKPGVNDVYYVHVVIAGLGNACSAQLAYVELGLPANTTLAIDGTNKVYCFYDGALLAASECPQSLPASTLNAGMVQIPSTDSSIGYTWPVVQGKFLEFQIPVRSSTTLSNSQMHAKVWMLDGNDSPWLQPQQGVYVFGTQQMAILYNTPSTTNIASTTAHSEAILYSYKTAGTGYFDIGTDTTYSLPPDPVAIPNTWDGVVAYVEWGPPALLPDTLYHWRFRFVPVSGPVVYGADQTFRTLPANIATVGSGMTGSCTEAAFNSALASGKTVTFACGPLPTTITLTGAKTIASSVAIEGDNLVTLSTSGSSNHFNVQASGHLFLNQVKLENGMNDYACGGSIRVLGNGQLTTNETTFRLNSTSYRGGAVCVEANGYAEFNSTQFSENQAPHGGAVYNAGTMVAEYSAFANNSADFHGGGLQNYAQGNLTDTTFSDNEAGYNGGAIDDIGTLYVTRGTFTGNIAGIRGGAINEYVGTLIVADSKFTGNHSLGYGGAIANDVGTVTIVRSEISNNTAVSVGGGLRSNGTTNVGSSTISGNHVDGNGGGIENSETGAILVLLNTTLVGNSAGGQGGNLYIGSLSSNHIQLKNTLVASGAPNNCDQPVSSQGYNLESTNSCGLNQTGDLVNREPKLGSLADNGGGTRTHALLSGSPAIEAGTNDGCLPNDQRSVARPFDGDQNGTATCDIGAYEFEGQSSLMIYLPFTVR